MDIITLTSIIFLVVLFLLSFLLKSVKKAIGITFLLLFIVGAGTVWAVLSDAKELGQIQESTSLFVYSKNTVPLIGTVVNFAGGDPKTLIGDDLTKEIGKEAVTDYFKIFTFSRKSFESLLPETLELGEGVSFTKAEILEGLDGDDVEVQGTYLTVAAAFVLQQLGYPEVFSSFLKHYKVQEIRIEPPIKAVSVLAYMPEPMVTMLLERGI